mmetsp:Transcript_60244/g.196908  ORF Transcript_60244/g.196908 Transcript_60244/m.196908 type:complete len:466 (+) Transcript_60244:4746-6143(+)
MQGSDGEQGVDRHSVLTRAAVGEHDEGHAIAQDGGLGLFADLVQTLPQQGLFRDGAVRLARPRRALGQGVGHVDDSVHEALALELEQGVKAPRTQHRCVQEDAAARLRLGVQQIQLRPEGAQQRHDVGFADGVDGRVRGLCEELGEVVEGHLRQPREASQGLVRTHGAQGLVARFHHGRDEHLHLLHRVAEVLQQGQDALHHSRVFRIDAFLIHQLLDQGSVVRGLWAQHVLELQAVLLQVLRIRLLLRVFALELLVLNKVALLEIHQQHLARAQSALERHVLVVHVHDADFGAQDEVVVRGDVEATRPEAVAVQGGAELLAVCEGDQRRPIPRLHEARVVLVEGMLVCIHVLRILPCLGDHHHDDLGQVSAARGEEQLHDVVEQRGVAADVLVDGEEFIQVHVPEGLCHGHERLPGPDLVPVALQGVDLSVVSNAPERVSAVPGGEGVGGEPRVHDREVRLALL